MPAAILPPLLMIDCQKRVFWGPSWLLTLANGSLELFANAGYLVAFASAVVPSVVVLAARRIPGHWTLVIPLVLALLLALFQIAVSSFMGLFTAFRVILQAACTDPVPGAYQANAGLFLLGYALRIVGFSNAVHLLIHRRTDKSIIADG